ncbi:hypothetical protein [Ilumatobacter sp.]|uniref:hypothetical protein n=1 Tax=Ilumatobacter sp. TaxID=1967498 RepID=UPI003753C7A6|nr:hypothetical protein [Ilumatobacter sp.]
MTISSALTAPALSEVLTALGDRVAPVSMAFERTLPTPADCAELFAEGGLVRGRTLSSTGPAATTVMLRLVAAAVEAGGWMAVIDVPTLGLDAASELGIALERVVAIDTQDAGVWADVVAAAADGFEVLVTRVPSEVRPSTLRKVVTRLQQRGVVMMVVGDPGPLACDGVIDTGRQVWTGVGAGWGRLEQRVVEVTAAGRRLPGQRCRTMEFPVPELHHAEADNAEMAGVEMAGVEMAGVEAEGAPSIHQLSTAS